MKVNLFLTLLVFIPVINGCGQMGPLYLPGTTPPIHVEKEKKSAPVTEPTTESEKSTSSENK